MVGTNTGHGHVWERPDGVKARCGGPAICRTCSVDQGLWPGVRITWRSEEFARELTGVVEFASYGELAVVSDPGCSQGIDRYHTVLGSDPTLKVLR